MENRNYVTVDSVDGKIDNINLDEKFLVGDARKIAEKIKSWDRREFQNKIISTVKNLNEKFGGEKDLLENEQQTDQIILRLAKSINEVINKYIDSMNIFDLGTELDAVSENADLQTQEFIQGIKAVAAKRRVKQEMKLSVSEQLLADDKKRRDIFAGKSVGDIFKNLF